MRVSETRELSYKNRFRRDIILTYKILNMYRHYTQKLDALVEQFLNEWTCLITGHADEQHVRMYFSSLRVRVVALQFYLKVLHESEVIAAYEGHVILPHSRVSIFKSMLTVATVLHVASGEAPPGWCNIPRQRGFTFNIATYAQWWVTGTVTLQRPRCKVT